MPIYEFQCESCGLSHEQLVRKVGDHGDRPCTACGENARKKPSVANASWGNQQTGTRGILSSSTGVSAIDHSVDMRIGRDASKRWGAIEQRESEKATLRRRYPGQPLIKTPEGHYETGSKEVADRNTSLSVVASEAHSYAVKTGQVEPNRPALPKRETG